MLLNLCAVQDSKPRPLDYQGRFIPTATSTWFRGSFYVCIQMAMTTKKATKLGHDQVAHLEACFVIVLLIFHCTSSSVTDKSHVHTRIEQSVVFKDLSGFNSLNWNVCVVACRQWGDSQVWEQIMFNSCINCWQDHQKSISAFLRFLNNQLTFSVEL